jgi:beta-lactamase superfamily II metal-dependent hydrolase
MNMYGHPSPEVIERYEDAGVQVFRNDTQGAVGILGKRIKSMLDQKVR